MARTVHTDPNEIRAQRRLSAPRGLRGDGDGRGGRSTRTALSELELPAPEQMSEELTEWPLPRISRSRPRPGFAHPVEPPAIRAALRSFGPTCVYGLSRIELRQSTETSAGSLSLASLRIPGTIILFEQPVSPWTLDGALDPIAAARMTRAGADVELTPNLSTVTWPGASLPELMLFDGLFHEIGHHLIQHYEGKRSARKMRTADHERRADAFARACRAAWSDAQAN